jgi:hypothetical protein
MRLSKLTIGFALYIIISASFATKIWEFFDKLVGDNFIGIFRIVIFLIFALSGFIYIIRSYSGDLRIFAAAVVLYLALVFSWRQPYFVEKLHIFEYGFLGWLAAKDFNRDRTSLGCFLLSLLFILLVAALDEIFQYFLPYRVADIRDVITDVISGTLGIVLRSLK